VSDTETHAVTAALGPNYLITIFPGLAAITSFDISVLAKNIQPVSHT